MATLEQFLKTGRLGSLALGCSTTDAIGELGDPVRTSTKSNPLILDYTGLKLTFVKSGQHGLLTLSEIDINAPEISVVQPPAILGFSDFQLTPQPTKERFQHFYKSITYTPLVEHGSSRITFASGVVATFAGDMLEHLTSTKRELRIERPGVSVADEREATLTQIGEMIAEAQLAHGAQAERAAFLLIWAAVEALLRREARRVGLTGKIGISPANLIRDLYAAGSLSKDDFLLLESARQARTVAAHGLAPRSIGGHDLPDLLQYARRLSLASSGPKAHDPT